MAIADYRYDPFLDVINIKAVSQEKHTIPTSSPYTIRLNEVPQNTDPSTIICKFTDGTALTEVAAQPEQGQFWPDYSVAAGGDWNTGTLLFNSADAGKSVLVSYNGMGTLVDDRLPDMLQLAVTSSTQPERVGTVSSVSSYDSTVTNGTYSSSKITTVTGRINTHKGIAAGTYTLREIIQKLINLSHTQEYVKVTAYSDCNCDCGDDSS